jgi:hypothetical protein
VLSRSLVFFSDSVPVLFLSLLASALPFSALSFPLACFLIFLLNILTLCVLDVAGEVIFRRVYTVYRLHRMGLQ